MEKENKLTMLEIDFALCSTVTLIVIKFIVEKIGLLWGLISISPVLFILILWIITIIKERFNV